MAKQKRGSYRSTNSLMYDSEDWQKLSGGARGVYQTMRGTRLNNIAGVFVLDPGAVYTIAIQSGWDVEQTKGFLCELESQRWIVRGGGLVWLRNQVRFDPYVDPDDPLHRKALVKIVLSMAPCALLEEFCSYYGLNWPFPKRFINTQLPLEVVLTNENSNSTNVSTPQGKIKDSEENKNSEEEEGLTAERRRTPTVDELREQIDPKRTKPKSEHQEFIAYFKAEFDKRFAEQGLVYAFEGKKDGECVRRLLGRVSLQKAMEVAHYLLWDCEDTWIARIGGYKISTLLSQLNSLMQQMANVRPRAAPAGGPPRLQGNVNAAKKVLERMTDAGTNTAQSRLGDDVEGGGAHALESGHSGSVR